MEGYCSSCKIRFEGKRCPNPNCTLHGVAVQMQHAEEQRIDLDTRQALNDHYRDCAEKEAQERRVEQQLLQDAGIMHTTTQAPFPAHVLVVGGCFGFVLAMLLVATWFSFSASTEPTVVHAPSPGFYPPTTQRAPVVRKEVKKIDPAVALKKNRDACLAASKKLQSGRARNVFAFLGCEEALSLGNVPPGSEFLVRHMSSAVYVAMPSAQALTAVNAHGERDNAGVEYRFPKFRAEAVVVLLNGRVVGQFVQRPLKNIAVGFRGKNTSDKPMKLSIVQNSRKKLYVRNGIDGGRAFPMIVKLYVRNKK